jgi:hypothetical protein
MLFKFMRCEAAKLAFFAQNHKSRSERPPTGKLFFEAHALMQDPHDLDLVGRDYPVKNDVPTRFIRQIFDWRAFIMASISGILGDFVYRGINPPQINFGSCRRPHPLRVIPNVLYFGQSLGRIA